MNKYVASLFLFSAPCLAQGSDIGAEYAKVPEQTMHQKMKKDMEDKAMCKKMKDKMEKRHGKMCKKMQADMNEMHRNMEKNMKEMHRKMETKMKDMHEKMMGKKQTEEMEVQPSMMKTGKMRRARTQ